MNKLKIPKGVKWPHGPYLVTEYGKIFSLLSMRYIKPDKKGQVYLHVKGGKPVKRYVNRLTAQLYVPNPHNYPIVIVKPGKEAKEGEQRSGGHYTNLRWATHKQVNH